MVNLLFFLSFFFQNDYKYCNCGNFEDGIVTYQVIGAESGCCSGEAGEFGQISYYEPSGGAWKLVGFTAVGGAGGQEICCQNQNS
ncbi:hypothetical protein A9Q93_00970 [Nonlabens dokdonensis]|uniref:Uncharacterized protein n=1 Tax=Nonlabens dokdonensis TaxID=328515 RepID=A0A1Z8BFQ4_9FLAO|nr:hypothetical protein [Nonlabens dokdonensis]OUS21404.1 hypothetical protein A9Q93_00970 [Nonlabens dokdonensis]